ncbi:MAG: zinc metallopeptidase [Desulfobacterales bacterium]|nr:zinc metallopeptidase [Desulfobacterales bacterium]
MGAYLEYYSSMFILFPAIIFAMYAQAKVKSTFYKYLRVRNNRDITGAQAARRILEQNDLYDVPIERARGALSDHYDPRKRVLRLSDEVYNGTSIASVSVAAHEVGHALQHAHSYGPLKIRNAIAPTVGFASQAAMPLVILGLFLGSGGSLLMDIGIYLYSFAVFFQVITLPVEFNASSRAIVQLEANGLINNEEKPRAKKVLNAAAMTYVAAMAVAIFNLLRLIMLRDRD